MHHKLLTHRLRGFGAPEHSAAALRAALAAGVPYLEIDTRASADGAIFIHHDHTTRSPRRHIAHTRAHEVAQVRLGNGEHLLLLDDALRLFARVRRPHQRLCLDIKDFGFEAEHLRLVRACGVEAHVHFISWIPHTLARLHELGTTAPLHLSHTSLLEYPLLALLSRPWRRAVRRFGPFVLLGTDRHATPLDLRHGYQHSLVCDRLPAPLLDILTRSGGGICVHYRLAGRRLAAFCRDHGLQLWVFTARSASKWRELASRPELDVVFTDAASSIACNEDPRDAGGIHAAAAS